MSNTNGMVEVITEAYFNKFFPQPMPIPEHRARVAEVRELAVYLAANLEAAGFGPVKEAQAEALEEAAAVMDKSADALCMMWANMPMSVTASATLSATRHEARRVRARAAAVRGEG